MEHREQRAQAQKVVDKEVRELIRDERTSLSTTEQTDAASHKRRKGGDRQGTSCTIEEDALLFTILNKVETMLSSGVGVTNPGELNWTRPEDCTRQRASRAVQVPRALTGLFELTRSG